MCAMNTWADMRTGHRMIRKSPVNVIAGIVFGFLISIPWG